MTIRIASARKSSGPSRGLRAQRAIATAAAQGLSGDGNVRRLLHRSIAARLLDCSRDQLRVDVARALNLADAAAWASTALGERSLLAQALRARGNALAGTGRNQEAVHAHRRALSMLEQLGDEPEIARTLNAIIQPLILLGCYDQALAAADRARFLFEKEGDRLRLARLQINVGNILHRRDRFVEALRHYDQALRDLAPMEDVDGHWSALHNRAVTLISLNRFQAALADYERARALCVEHGRIAGIAQADYNIAWLYSLRGDYSRAIDLLRAAAETAARAGDHYHSALCLLDLSDVYLELNLSDDARVTAQRAMTEFRALGNRYELAKATANCAIALGQQGRAVDALDLFAEARALFVAEQNRIWPSLVDLYQAVLFFDEGRLLDARRLALAAMEVFYLEQLTAKAALCELLLARIDLRLGDAASARRSAVRLLAGTADLESPITSYHAWFTLGQAHTALGEKEAALTSYSRAREALELVRSRVRGEELKIAFVRNKIEVYERLVTLTLQDDASERVLAEAFSYIEQAKSRTLLDLMFQSAHAVAHAETLPGGFARRIRDIRAELNWYYHQIDKEQLQPGVGDRSKLAELQDGVERRERELARIVRNAAAAAPPDADPHALAVCGVEDVRAALPDGAVLVEYFEAEGRIFVAVLDRDRLAITPVAVSSSVRTHVHMLQFQFSKFRLGDTYLRRFEASLPGATRLHLAALFQELLAPVWRHIRGRRVVIVPHGLLHYIPFHALWDGTAHVIDSTIISYAPSASLFVRCQQRPDVNDGPVLVMAVADQRAPAMETEARQVAARFAGARLVVGADATQTVLRSDGTSARVVHIAAHGEFRPDNPMFSAIRLGDGRLNVYDLYRLRMPANLVTLSGCGTGASLAAAGDDLLGISRGLFLAGARRAVLSLWDVHDDATAALMDGFYRRVAGGEGAAIALRQAMLETREEMPHPFYWAPFFVTGRCDEEQFS